jgi:hypothetical protein
VLLYSPGNPCQDLLLLFKALQAPSYINLHCIEPISYLLAPQGFEGPDQLADALKGCDLVIIPAGVPRKPGMTRDDLFKVRPAA